MGFNSGFKGLMCTEVLTMMAVCGFSACILPATVLAATIVIVANNYAKCKKGDKIYLGKQI